MMMVWWSLGLLTILLHVIAPTNAVTLSGSSEYAVPGSDFTLTCDVPEEAKLVTFYRRPDLSTPVGSVQVAGSQCYNTKANPAIICILDVCSCVTTSTGGGGTVFRWVIQPQTGYHGSVWFCTRTNLNLTDQSVDSLNFTLNVANGPGTSIALSPPATTYTRTEGDALQDITCTADCRPDCTFVWTKPDNTNFTSSAVLSLGQLDKSEHGTYRCTAGNVIGTSTITTSVNVQYGPGKTTTISQPDVVYKENQTIPDVNCSADCRPSCTFIWAGDDNIYTNPLSLSIADRSNSGMYICTASNLVSKESKTWNLIVRFPPRILRLSYTQEDDDVTENELKSLFCSVESYPPSTIEWYFKANNSLLFTTPDVLKSTYTLTAASCLDTGLYTCSARNSVSNTAVTKDIRINVLCKPRLDSRVALKYKFALAISESLTIPAMFISNPAPSFNWTFQISPLVSATALVNGTEDFASYNTYVITNLSAVSEAIRINIKQEWFGLYNVTATNSQGSGTLSFTVEAKGKPTSPYEGTAICPYHDRAILSWRSPFNGGSAQYFAIGIKKHQEGNFVIDNNFNTSDPGQRQSANITVSGLTPGTQHFFMVYAVNEFGNSTLEEEVNCTTKAMPLPESSLLGSILGGVGGSVAAIILVIVVAVIVNTRRRKSGKSRKDDDTEMIQSKKRSVDDDSSDGMKTNILYESSDGLKTNILYESAGPQPGSSSEYAVVQKPSKAKSVPDAAYAVVDKSKDGKSNAAADAYAEIVKPKGKATKGKQKQVKMKQKGDGVDEKVGNFNGTVDNLYANYKDENEPIPNSGPIRQKNQDGLVYMDIEFKDDKQIGRNYVIHGIEDRTDYVDVDFTKQADPVPPDEKSGQPEEDGKKN